MSQAGNLPGETVTCDVCPRGCRLTPGAVGACKARRADAGVDNTVCGNYGRVTSLALDPIEKKPLACFMPGAKVLSAGSYGCNMTCPWCQNAEISCAGEQDVAWRQVSPQELVGAALDARSKGCAGLAFTYNEPLIGWEFVRDAASLAHEKGLINVLVSNGQANLHVIEELAPLIDAANIDLKCFDKEKYASAGGSLETVMRTIEALHAQGVHIEVTTLVVPGFSDSAEQIDGAAHWLADIDAQIPYHVTRFFGCHRMKHVAATPVAQVYSLAEVARKHLARTFVGNC